MADRKTKPDNDIKKASKPLVRLNDLFGKLANSLTGSDYSRGKELDKLSQEVDEVIIDEIRELTKFTGDDISTFIVKTLNEKDRNGVQQAKSFKDIEEVFTGDQNGLFSVFQERYRNQNILFEDINAVCSQLFDLKEAVLATRDAIVTSDDLTKNVSRQLKFVNMTDNDEQHSFIASVESMEKKFGILHKLKEHVIPNTLQYGRYYVYTVPYSKLFEKHYEKMHGDKKDSSTISLESVTEGFGATLKSELGIDSSVHAKKVAESFNDIASGISICNDGEMPIPVIESSEVEALMSERFKKQTEKAMRASEKSAGTANPFSEATVDDSKKKTPKVDFSDIRECYVKLIDPRKIIPIKVLDQVIGYYYVHETEVPVTKTAFTTSLRMNSQAATASPKEMESAFLSKLTDRIVKSFDKKYLEDNSKFKELILNAIMYNDVYKKNLKFQFIPVDYITEFAVNRNAEGEGTSIILPSIFYAKLFLALLIFKIITIISKSNDTRVTYIKQSGIDSDVANKLQDVARQMKERQINITDLLNMNSMVSKVGQAKEVYMPVGRSGEKGIEFDILAGQDVQLNNELMDLLRQGYINATGVPSVIMNYIGEADYAKTLVMANAKFLGRVVNDQMDINTATTELYQKLLAFTTDIPEEKISEFEFALSTPRALTATNMSDLISNVDQTIAFMFKSRFGENAQPTDDENKIKDRMYKGMSKEFLPMLPWGTMDEIWEQAQIELEQQKAYDKSKGGGDATS